MAKNTAEITSSLKNGTQQTFTEEVLLEKLAIVENELEIENITHNNYRVWPIIKDKLFFEALFKNVNKVVDTVENENAVVLKQHFLRSLFKESRNSINGYFVFKKSLKKFQLNFLVDKKQLIFLDGANSSYLDSVEGKKYSRYLTPYFEYVGKQRNAALINFTTEPEITGKYIQPYYVNVLGYFSFYNLKEKIKNKIGKKKSQTNGLEQLNQKLRQIDYPVLIDKNTLGYMINEIEAYKSIYTHVFKNTKPKAVFMECYYGNPNYLGATLAAKEFNIKMIDIQHGVSFDPMYLGWNKMPKTGYELLPDIFWVWSNYDIKTIQESRKNSTVLAPVLGGNLWYKKYLEIKPNTEHDKILAELRSKYERTILITLDHSGPMYTCLFEAIRCSSKNWLWLVRFHPHDYKDPGYRERYIAEFNKFSNVHYEHSTKCNLFNLLNIVDFNISRYSSVCIEALTFKVPSIIIMCKKKIAQLDVFEKSNCFIYSSDGNEISDIIKNDRIFVDDANYDFFRMRQEDDQVKEALNNILN